MQQMSHESKQWYNIIVYKHAKTMDFMRIARDKCNSISRQTQYQRTLSGREWPNKYKMVNKLTMFTESLLRCNEDFKAACSINFI